MADRKHSTPEEEGGEFPVETKESEAPEVEMSDDTAKSQDERSSKSSNESDPYAELTYDSTMDVNGDIHNIYRMFVNIPADHPCQLLEEFDHVPAEDDAVSRHRLAALVNLNMTREEYDRGTGPLTAHDIGVALGDSDFTVEWAMDYLLGLVYRDSSLQGIRNCLTHDEPMIAVVGKYRYPLQGYEGTAGQKGIYEGLTKGTQYKRGIKR